MRKKINVQLVTISVLAVASTVIMMLFAFYDSFQNQVKDDLEVNALVLKHTGLFNKENIGSLHFNYEKLRVTWIDADGNVLYDNDADIGNMDNHMSRPEIKSAFADGEGSAVRKSKTLNTNTFYYAVRLTDGSVLRVARNASNIWSILTRVLPIAVVTLILMIALCIVLAHFMTRNLLRPIEQMAVDINDFSITPAYRELVPFVTTIRAQHADILKSARMRQDFTANVSHELKTPLTAISGYAELIENGMVAPSEIGEFAGKIRKNARRLLSLINDIIRLSELDSADTRIVMEKFDLLEETQVCVENLQMYAQKNDVTISCEGEPVEVTANRDMIGELINNLCENAIRYNNKNGTVCVKTGSRDGHAFLCVKDTGIGIPKEHQKRIFERFYRVDKSRSKQTGGTGLGLAIVKHVVALHDAQIHLESEEGKGTEITVIF
ncbi:MAG: ATP-binding protein [Eubacterium sp.]|nr:ATP-binding protein [Eubacterium sp.]MDY5496781.1 ATP-binding protein [Anaerobutyricum sp.]